MPPHSFRLLGVRGYEFIFGGFVWRFVVTGRAAPKVFSNCSIQLSGRLYVQVKSVMEVPSISEFMQKRIQLEREPDS